MNKMNYTKSIPNQIDIAIIFADELEFVEPQSLNLEIIGDLSFGNFRLFKLRYKNIVFLYGQSRIGLLNATSFCQYLIDNYNISVIINYGAVGSVDLPINSQVYPSHFYYLDAKTPWYPNGQTPGEVAFYQNNLWAKEPINLASSSSFITDEQQLAGFENIKVFDMEVFALAKIAHNFSKKFYCLKYVSDNLGNNKNLVDVNAIIKEGARSSFELVISKLEEIANSL